MNIVRKFFDWYKRSMKSRPLMTASLSSGTMFTLGDYSTQIFIEKGQHKPDKTTEWYIPDWERLWKWGFMSTFIGGPFGFFWYGRFNPWYLGRIARMFPKAAGNIMTNAKKRIIASTILDVYLFSFATTPFFTFVINYLETDGDYS